MAYFDNAATTYPKPECVYDYMDRFYRGNGASVGRGNYEKAVTAHHLLADTRKQIQNLLHCPAKQVIFTPTATVALNMIIQGLLQNGKKTVYITPFEHNAVTRVLHCYEEKNKADRHILKVTSQLEYDIGAIERQFEMNRPDIVIMSHASNVCGLIAPVEKISVLAKRYGAVVVIDMAQTAGLVDCNIGLETIDFAVFAGHKTLYGPTGISGFVMNPSIDLPAVYFGGTGFESANQNMPESIPERFEIGTMNISGIAGLNAALHWISEVSLGRIRNQETQNRQKLLGVLSEYSFIKPVGISPSGEYVGVVSALIDGISSDSAGSVFDRLGISVRTGLQCAPLAHKFLGTFPSGTIRFSVGYFTNDDDFKALREALSYIRDNL